MHCRHFHYALIRSSKGLWVFLPTAAPPFGVVHRLDEFDGGDELHPPVLVLARHPVAVEGVDVLDGGEEPRRVGLDHNKHHHGHEVVGRGNGSCRGTKTNW